MNQSQVEMETVQVQMKLLMDQAQVKMETVQMQVKMEIDHTAHMV